MACCERRHVTDTLRRASQNVTACEFELKYRPLPFVRDEGTRLFESSDKFVVEGDR